MFGFLVGVGKAGEVGNLTCLSAPVHPFGIALDEYGQGRTDKYLKERNGLTGGLRPGSSVLATLQTYRSGVWVAGVRLNYPTSGRVRVYLNKVASTTATTPVAWFVLG